MDGLKDTVPLGKPFVEHEQIGLFDLDENEAEEEEEIAMLCVIKDWNNNKIITFRSCKEKGL